MDLQTDFNLLNILDSSHSLLLTEFRRHKQETVEKEKQTTHFRRKTRMTEMKTT